MQSARDPYPQLDSYAMQMHELNELEKRERNYSQKIAALREMTNVFLIMVCCFVVSWVPLVFYEVHDLPTATWNAVSMSSFIALVILMVYAFMFNSSHKKALDQLNQRRMALGLPPKLGSLPSLYMGQQEQQYTPPQQPQFPPQQMQPQPQPQPQPQQPPPLPEDNGEGDGNLIGGSALAATRERDETGRFVPIPKVAGRQ